MLNRTAISSGAYLESFDSLPKDILWTQAQIDQSLAETMSRRPEQGDLWVFAYGSLMWNPVSEYDSRVIATLDDWRRSFCIRLIAGRGSPEKPGRMLSLEPGGTTEGVALRMPESTLNEELRILWIREMVTGAYTPTWAPIRFRAGGEAIALVFVANSHQAQFEPDARPAAIAPLMAVASGSFGTNAEYVFKLQRALADCQMCDSYIDELAAQLQRLT
ncbi:gamma-glutamylcyclotransferase [Paraburkholderia fynbosensis]|uniref:glutathione-specific gamma-glutamylcyclotransferase n=1 Tax=Paraburkholderia fynbosensis TaxID=1200993 RepID=A0A6J5G916_9BURK|nr:gamma-glutamylcyclotransferase [Paraburkholderia fynbosensis]CAB3794628.1 Glutathione-specific gamma-glutamylcyclotransferase [Paraburkholderia fynbosensis]